MDYFISLYIDNELSREEKILFLEHVYSSKAYKDDAVSLLRQEKLLRHTLKHQAPTTLFSPRPRRRTFRSFSLAIAACMLLVLSFLAGTKLNQQNQTTQTLASITVKETISHRFVLYNQESETIEITGSFSNWQKLPLAPAGPGGYWEITLEIPAGEHRYSFIADGTTPLPDPTVATQEADDFGTINSILNVES